MAAREVHQGTLQAHTQASNTAGMPGPNRLAVVGIVGEILSLALSAWVLRRKGQTLWFLVALLLFWWLIFLIPNKNAVKPVIEYEYDDTPKAG